MPHAGDKNNSFKNPLGIIGVFLVLIEAIASLVIVKSHLNDFQNNVLVFFIVLFPCLVLGAFFLLVTRHHEKLYSPGDYKDERNFVNTYNPLTQKEERRSLSAAPEAPPSVTEADLQPLKDALAEVLELQKKMVLNPGSPPLSEDETHTFISTADGLISEMEDDTNFEVHISPMPGSDRLARILTQKGYQASIYRAPSDGSPLNASLFEHTAIWVGDQVPVDTVVQVIQIAKKTYPHLTYLFLNDDSRFVPSYVRYQLFIGGATSTAKDRRLKPLSSGDFEKLYRIAKQEDLHAFIRSFYPQSSKH